MKTIILLQDPSKDLKAELEKKGAQALSLDPPVVIDVKPEIHGGRLLSEEKIRFLNSEFSVALVSEDEDSSSYMETALHLVKPTRNFGQFKLSLSDKNEVQSYSAPLDLVGCEDPFLMYQQR